MENQPKPVEAFRQAVRDNTPHIGFRVQFEQQKKTWAVLFGIFPKMAGKSRPKHTRNPGIVFYSKFGFPTKRDAKDEGRKVIKEARS